ncbi:ABC transporter permease [candidate division KSB1 bacterium]
MKLKKPPKFGMTVLDTFLRPYDKEEVIGSFELDYDRIYNEKGKVYANSWFWKQVYRSIIPLIILRISWGMIMFGNYLKIAFRNFKRNKGFTFINIFGLAAGISACIVIMLYVQFELGYDSYHKDSGLIYRIVQEETTKNGIQYSSLTPSKMGLLVKDNLPQIEYAVRIDPIPRKPANCSYADKTFFETKVVFSDNDLFKVFRIPILSGDPSDALTRPGTIVLSETMADKYIGNKDPVGEILQVNGRELEITGVFDDLPENTHHKYDFVWSIHDLDADSLHRGWWFGSTTHTYVKVFPETDIESLENSINDLVSGFIEIRGDFVQSRRFFLQPVEDIHLNQGMLREAEPPGNPQYIFIFSTVGILILFIASMNFMNLSTARSIKRANEIGVRKVAGAQKSQLFRQFIGESILLTFMSVVSAILIVIILMPFLNNYFEMHLQISDLAEPSNIGGIAVLMMVTGFLSGWYPALFLSSLKPSAVLKGSVSLNRGTFVRKCLVVLQFTISIAMVIGTVIIFKQIEYMKNESLGFDINQKLVLRYPYRPHPGSFWASVSPLYQKQKLVKAEFLKHPSVSGATASSTVPGRTGYPDTINPIDQPDKMIPIGVIHADEDFLSVFDIEIIAGEKNIINKSLSENEIILNESAVEALGYRNPEQIIGQTFNTYIISTVVGVVKNFNFKGLQSSIEPIYLSSRPISNMNIVLDLDTGNIDEAISFIKDKHKEIFPNEAFDFYFLDEYFNMQYRFEDQIGRVFRIFTILGIIIAMLGLLGLSFYMVEQRTKEIGIRKVLGANVLKIMVLLSKGFTKWIMIAYVLAGMISIYTIDRWLRNFAYKADIGWYYYILPGVIILVLALLSVGYQIFKAARSNPVDSLKYE